MEGRKPSGAPRGPLTVAAALRETSLRDARIAAGRRGLERRIALVAVLSPGEVDALQPRALLLSSVRPLRRLDLGRLVARLAGAGVSALGVSPDDAWTGPPEELVASCEERGLPLLLLPEGRFQAPVNPVLEAIVERQSERLRRIGELHDALTRAALGNEPMPRITATVARVLGVPVAVFDE